MSLSESEVMGGSLFQFLVPLQSYKICGNNSKVYVLLPILDNILVLDFHQEISIGDLFLHLEIRLLVYNQSSKQTIVECTKDERRKTVWA